ncbi:MAG: GNAT family N-acetyltransferase [Fimbriimonadaceae bacterium]|nr:GNAT family N-acetyltransferase [Fimbriimonadaceae bacterium]
MTPLPGWEQRHSELDAAGLRRCVELVWLGAKLDRGFVLPCSPAPPGKIVLATAERRADLLRVLTLEETQPPAFEDATLGLFERPGAFTLLAYDGDRPVATGCLYVQDGVAYLANGLTIPDARGRGFQTHLIRRRIEVALDIGARIAVSATYRFL